MTEIWVDIKGFEDFYQISNMGNVRSKDRVVACSRLGTKQLRGRLLSCTVDSSGYARVTLQDKPRKEVWKVHRLVALHFLDKPEECDVVNHLDSNRVNNCVGNLEWCTPKQNTGHMHKSGRGGKFNGESNPMHKLTEADVHKIRGEWKDVPNLTLALEFSVSEGHIDSIKKFRRWSHLMRCN